MTKLDTSVTLRLVNPTLGAIKFMQRFQILTTNNDIDFENLRSAKEGWFVEFKLYFNKSETASKSISSFLNTYGGYIIVGAEEQIIDSQKKFVFVGMTSDYLKKQLSLISDTIKRNIQPTPLVKIHTFNGPIEEIGLIAGKSILIIDIPPGFNPPYISSSGRIYRRRDDSSEPEQEGNRYVLDELYEKSIKIENRVASEISTIDYAETVDNYKLSNHNLYFFPILFPAQLSKGKVSLNTLRPLIEEFSKDHIKIDSYYLEGRNVIFRNVETNQLNRSGFTAVFDRDTYAFKVRILTSETGISNLRDRSQVDNFIHDREHFPSYCALLREENIDSISILDFTPVASAFTKAYVLYKRILNVLGSRTEIRAKFQLNHLRGKFAFVNHPAFIEHCRKHKPPMFISDNIQYPRHNRLESFTPLHTKEAARKFSHENPKVVELTQAVAELLTVHIDLFESIGLEVTADFPFISLFA